MNLLTRIALSLCFGGISAFATLKSQQWLSFGYPQKYYWDAMTLVGSMAGGNLHQPSTLAMMTFIVIAPAMVCFLVLILFWKK